MLSERIFLGAASQLGLAELVGSLRVCVPLDSGIWKIIVFVAINYA